MKLLVGLFFAITFANISFGQETKKEKLINVSSCNKEGFWDCYKEKLIFSVTQEVTKGLLCESLLNSTERDTVHLAITYWMSKNGDALSNLFGSSLDRETPEFNALKKIIVSTKLDTENLPKRVRIPREGKQFYIQFYFRKVTNKKGVKFLRPFKYQFDNSEIFKHGVNKYPIYPGCTDFVELNEKNNLRAKQCLQNEITALVTKNYNISAVRNIPILYGKSPATYINFIISKEGEIKDAKAISLHPQLEYEAFKSLSSFKKVQPGLHLGKPVNVFYNLPIRVSM